MDAVEDSEECQRRLAELAESAPTAERLVFAVIDDPYALGTDTLSKGIAHTRIHRLLTRAPSICTSSCAVNTPPRPGLWRRSRWWGDRGARVHLAHGRRRADLGSGHVRSGHVDVAAVDRYSPEAGGSRFEAGKVLPMYQGGQSGYTVSSAWWTTHHLRGAYRFARMRYRSWRS
ncbi:hypothetical protein GCM10027590_32520 [Nocardiopsis nanhaiensis]